MSQKMYENEDVSVIRMIIDSWHVSKTYVIMGRYFTPR